METNILGRIGVVAGLILVLGSITSAQAATSGSHYPYGTEGIMAASLPPPGNYFLQYDSYYHAGKLNDDNGNKLDVGFDIDVWASVQRLVHVSEYSILGGNYFCNIIVPLVDKSLTIKALGISDDQDFNIGDIFIEPLGIAWHGQRWDGVAALGVFAPTGNYDSDDPASIGLGYWSFMFSLGGTYYFDEKKTWTFSALSRTLVNTEQEDTNVTPGTELIIEYGLGKTIPFSNNLLFQAGMAGSAYWQVGHDSENFGPIVKDEHKQVYALGPEVNFHWLQQGFIAKLRFEQDFKARNTSEGNQVVLTLIKSF